MMVDSHSFYQQVMRIEERTKRFHKTGVVSSLQTSTNVHADDAGPPVKGNPAKRYFARGFPHRKNNNSDGFAQCLSDSEDLHPSRWESSTLATSRDALVPMPVIDPESVMAATPRKLENPLNQPHFTFMSKTVPRLQRMQPVMVRRAEMTPQSEPSLQGLLSKHLRSRSSRDERSSRQESLKSGSPRLCSREDSLRQGAARITPQGDSLTPRRSGASPFSGSTPRSMGSRIAMQQPDWHKYQAPTPSTLASSFDTR